MEKRVEFFCDEIKSEVKVIIQVVSHESFVGLSFSSGSRCKEKQNCGVKSCTFINQEEAKIIEEMKLEYEKEKSRRQKDNEWKF